MKMKSHPSTPALTERADHHPISRGNRTPHKRRPSSILSDPTMSYSTPADLDVQSEAQEVSSSTYLARLRRATQSRYLGYESKSYVNNNTSNTQTRTVTSPRILPSSRAPDDEVMLDAKETNVDVTLNFFKRFENLEGKKRLAQDSLLLKELELGILPEHLLKKLPHMKHVTTIDLSHYGIGDKLGICLGLRYSIASYLNINFIFTFYCNKFNMDIIDILLT